MPYHPKETVTQRKPKSTNMLAFKIIVTQLMIMLATSLVGLITAKDGNYEIERIAEVLLIIEVFVLILSLCIAIWLI